mmetsp:Transcript_3286/g.11558  ORF Transcript_3286/g.11558 Transcript_3286/m.11558 type:complete len:302 (+) Transcript_3286:1027-1932(+)
MVVVGLRLALRHGHDLVELCQEVVHRLVGQLSHLEEGDGVRLEASAEVAHHEVGGDGRVEHERHTLVRAFGDALSRRERLHVRALLAAGAAAQRVLLAVLLLASALHLDGAGPALVPGPLAVRHQLGEVLLLRKAQPDVHGDRLLHRLHRHLQRGRQLHDCRPLVQRHKDLVEQVFEVVAHHSVHHEALQRRYNDLVVVLDGHVEVEVAAAVEGCDDGFGQLANEAGLGQQEVHRLPLCLREGLVGLLRYDACVRHPPELDLESYGSRRQQFHDCALLLVEQPRLLAALVHDINELVPPNP